MFYQLRFFLLIFILNGCVKPVAIDPASTLAKKQVDKIRPYLPVKNEHYVLMMAQHQANKINMIFMQEQGAEFTKSPDQFLEEYKKQLCASNEILNVLQQNVLYDMSINGSSNKPLARMSLSYKDCLYKTEKP
ncbi:type II secretion system pilot lipoprotein GspS-beta [Candidatus Williamhamiltonella defendens]|uniref:type II secretion system pilot lipoprotein GspS-beta n=2 Tax=Candidatus Williamhamiltonella defendens TaxID=138072 RepID=UPI000310D4A3|nr:type II secretion system pilot lipoprotein GspS-beta [Candidatus Hamiltonella defensa]